MSEDKNQINAKDFVIGTLIGGIVGASAALFLAPKAGKELRSELNDQTEHLREKTKELTAVAREKGSDFANLAKEGTDEITKKVSEQSANLISKAKTLSGSKEDSIYEEKQVEVQYDEAAVTEDKVNNDEDSKTDELEEDALGTKS